MGGVSRPSAPGRRARGSRRPAVVAVVAAVALLALVLAARGGQERSGRAASQPFRVGAGARSALVLPARGPRRRPAVVFLHGWGLTGPKAYRGWLRHLAARGSTVIVPRYQRGLRTPSLSVPGNAIAGVRAALRRLRPRPSRVVVVGHSVGGILALDYAAGAESLGLPPALAVVSIYPGGVIRDMPPIPENDPATLPAGLRRLLVFESTQDEVVGTTPAETIRNGATALPDDRRELVTVEDPVAGDHFAPAMDSAAARRTFWAPVDRLLRSLATG